MKATRVNKLSDSKIPEKIGFGVTNLEVYRIIENKIALHYQLLPSQFINTSRKMGICEARQMFQYFMRKHTTYSLPEIGYYSGGLDHADVSHNIKKIKQLTEVYPSFLSMVSNIDEEIIKAIGLVIEYNLAS